MPGRRNARNVLAPAARRAPTRPGLTLIKCAAHRAAETVEKSDGFDRA